MSTKNEVHDFWAKGSCGEIYANGQTAFEYYEEHARQRYTLEPYIREFANCKEGESKTVLEVGVGMGADHLEWARCNPSALYGMDLTYRSVIHVTKRMAAYGFRGKVFQGDAERLPFSREMFDIVYSWGVLHHSPNI
jgi:ubiquinone/menaquinone biosynthesis C-methylase UbiE